MSEMKPTPEPMDNLKSAMDKVAETIEPTVSSIIKEDDGPASDQVLIRTTKAEKARWKKAADTLGIPMSQFFREVINARAEELIGCTHPMNMRRFYPWAQFCNKCNTRLK